MSAVGMIPDCRPLPDCGGGATRRRASASFCASVGIAKANSTVDMAQLEFCIRDDLNQKAPRVLAVLKPLKGGD